MNSMFHVLCKCLAKVGKIVGWNYDKASVYICIHLWPLLCVAMALALITKAILLTNPLWIIVCSIYAMFNIFGYWAVIKHYYPGSIEEIFEHCYSDLKAIAEEWNTSYAIVNLIIYVVLFIAIMAFDLLLILLMK